MRACQVPRYWTRIASGGMMEAVRGRRQTRTELQLFELGACPATPYETFANDDVTILKADRLAM